MGKKMRKSKYICVNDVTVEIEKTNIDISIMENEIRKNLKRLEYLNSLEKYLVNDCLCPLLSKDMLFNDIKLQEFVTPIMCRQDILSAKEDLKKDNVIIRNDVSPETMCKILSDFINFVCEKKGHKIGVGNYYIEKFAYENINKY